jgi:hypothetical protein
MAVRQYACGPLAVLPCAILDLPSAAGVICVLHLAFWQGVIMVLEQRRVGFDLIVVAIVVIIVFAVQDSKSDQR